MNFEKTPIITNQSIKRVMVIGIAIGVLWLRMGLKPSKCEVSCKKISTEISLLNCLDSCALNAPRPSFRKCLVVLTIIISLFILLTKSINTFVIEKKKINFNKFFRAKREECYEKLLENN